MGHIEYVDYALNVKAVVSDMASKGKQEDSGRLSARGLISSQWCRT
jgi:hypothetical protein